MELGNGDDRQKKPQTTRGSADAAKLARQEPSSRAEAPPLFSSSFGAESRASVPHVFAHNGLRPKLDALLGKVFPICSNIGTRLIIEEGTPFVVLEDGTRPLERYPLRTRLTGDPATKTMFRTDMATIKVIWDGTSVDFDVKPHGVDAFLGRWIPGFENLDEWIAFDRELRDPNKVTVVRPGLDIRTSVMLFEA